MAQVALFKGDLSQAGFSFFKHILIFGSAHKVPS